MNVEQILATLNHNTTSINLEFRMIDSIQPYLMQFAKFPKLKFLNLHGNNLTTLADDLSFLNVEELDLTSNPIIDHLSLIRQLATLPRLFRLSINLQNRDQEQIYIENLSQLRFLNNREINQVGFKQRDLDRIAIQYEMIRAITKEESLFEEHVHNIMKDFQLRVGQNIPLTKAKTHQLRARYGLEELVFSRVIEIVQETDEKLGHILQLIHDEHADIFKELSNLTLSQEEVSSGVSPYLEKMERQELRIKQLEGEMQEQLQTIDLLQEENRKYLDIIIRHGKTDKQQQQQSQQQQQQLKLDINNKLLTLKQLKEFITDIYESKSKYDQRCQENHLPRETMEQHMYTYLNQKYGLKNLIIEQASNIIQSIKKYQNDDNDIQVFGKIMRNECDEEFRFVQMQVKQTVGELLRMFLRQKHPLKNLNDIKEIWLNKLQGALTYEEMSEVVQYMYNAEDSRNLLNKIQTSLKSQQKLDYNVFLQKVLEFQLQTHERYLHKFIKLFRQIDFEKKGLLNRQQVQQLCKQLDLDEDFMLNKMSETATFSSIVTLLSSEKWGEQTLLQRISQQ